MSSSGWKQQRCVSCHTIYRYLFSRQARRTAVPCPSCGRIQPDVVGRQLARGHRTVTRLAVTAIVASWSAAALALAAIRVGHQVLTLPSRPLLPIICAAAGLLTLLGHALVELNHPNALMRWNRSRARRLLKRGVLAVDQQGVPGGAAALPARLHPSMAGMWVCLIGLISLTLPVLAPPLMGWPINLRCNPPVVGPGDQTSVVLRTPASLTLLGPNPGVVANDFALTNYPAYAEVHVSDNRRLDGRTVHLELVGPQKTTTELVLALAPPMASFFYVWVLCRLGCLAGLACMAVGGHSLVLASKDLARQANPIVDIPLQAVPTPLKG